MITKLKCNYPTIEKIPCQNLITNGTSKCAAGHPVNKASVFVKDASSYTIPVTANDVAAGTVDYDELSEPNDWADKGQKYAAKMSEALGFPEGDFEHISTISGERPRLFEEGTTKYKLARCALNTDAFSKERILAYGSIGKNIGKHWYLETPCSEYGCGTHAYMKLRNEESWDPNSPCSDEDRRDNFIDEIQETDDRADGKSMCFEHKLPF